MCRNYTPEDWRIIHQFKRGNPHICYYCGKVITDEKDLTVDHKIPRSRFGKTWYSNLCICCSECNKEKGDMTDTEYIEYRQNKNSKHLKTLMQEIEHEKNKKLNSSIIKQEHVIMEARNDSKTRNYIRRNRHLEHMERLFNKVETM